MGATAGPENEDETPKRIGRTEEKNFVLIKDDDGEKDDVPAREDAAAQEDEYEGEQN